jgi:mycofactocin precursor
MADTTIIPTNQTTISEPPPAIQQTTDQKPLLDQPMLEEEIEEELIIEDFTIDGICGVY